MGEFSQVNLSYNLRKDKKIISYNSKAVHYGTEMLYSVIWYHISDCKSGTLFLSKSNTLKH